MKHLFNKLAAFIVMLLTATNMFADKVVTIGTVNGADGGYGEAKFPMYSAYECSETEFLYTADDLKDLPVGDIVKMSYAVYGGDYYKGNLHVSLWLENTDDTTLGGEDDLEMKSTDEMTRVLSEKDIDYTNIESIEVATLDNPAYLDLKFDQSFEYTGGGLRVHFRSWSYYYAESDFLFPQDLTKIHERPDNNCILRYAYGNWGSPKIKNPGRMFPVVKFTMESATTEAIHHTPCQPTLSQPGYTVECWESDGKFYSDEACTQELKDMALAKAVVYAKLPVSSVSSTYEFDQSEHENDWDVDFNWAAVTTFQDAKTNTYTTTRYAEFTPTGDNVSNARLVWMRSHGNVVNGRYTVKIYVNGVAKFSIDQNHDKNVEGVFVQPLPGLKKGDVVKFEVTPNASATWYDDDPDPTFKASLEYTGTFGHGDLIHHTVCQPTHGSRGYTVECWEDTETSKFYSDADCTQELTNRDLALAVVYEKLPYHCRPFREDKSVNAVNGFKLGEEQLTHMGVTHNWPGYCIFKHYMPAENRRLDLTVRNNISNARLVWSKDKGATEYGKYTINIYVGDNESSYYAASLVSSTVQGDNALEGVFVQSLPELKNGDRVYFEVIVNEAATVSDNNDYSTIMASLEYTLSDAPVLNANEDPDHPGVYYTTFYDSSTAYITEYSGATAYTATISDNNLLMQPVSYIHKGEAVIIRSNSNKMALLPLESGAAPNPENVLRGVDEETTQDAYGDYQYYMLSYGQNNLGFYRMNAETPLAAHKAFLPLSDDRQARSMRMVFADDDEVDGIENINDDPSTSSGQAQNIYSISGVRQTKLQKGINIVNGKKVIVK